MPAHRGCCFAGNFVPAHVRHLQALPGCIRQRIAKIAHLPGNNIQAIHATVFLRRAHHRLQANADRQHRNVLFSERLRQQLITLQAPYLCHAVANGAHAGKYHAVRLADQFSIMSNHHLVSAHVLQRAGDGVQVAHAVINNGDNTTHRPGFLSTTRPWWKA